MSRAEASACGAIATGTHDCRGVKSTRELAAKTARAPPSLCAPLHHFALPSVTPSLVMAASLLLFALAPIFRRADVVSRAPPKPRGAVQWRSMATLAAAFCATPAIAATLTPKPVREALARFSRAFRRLRHGQTIAAYPAAFASILDEEAKAERADAKAERTERAAERQRAYDRRMEEQWRPREKASMKDVEVEEVDWDDLDEAPPPRNAAAPPPPQGLLGRAAVGEVVRLRRRGLSVVLGFRPVPLGAHERAHVRRA